MSNEQVPIIDLFAGPGGLGEGFTSVVDEKRNRLFKIALSIECDKYAHQTLTLRSFLRQFKKNELPDEYYDFIKGKTTIEELYNKYPKQASDARNEAWLTTLGKTSSKEIDSRIEKSLNKRKNWILIGGPPCQAYSNAGRSRVGGISEKDHRVYLYKEYLRIIAQHHPTVFVMENVQGLLSAKINEEKVFDWMLRDLRDPASVFPSTNSPKYKIYSLAEETITKDSDYLLKAENYGIPQKRHRVILLGVREDISTKPGILQKQKIITSLHDVIGKLPALRSRINREFLYSENVLTKEGKTKKRRYYKNLTDSYESWEKLIEKFRKQIQRKWNENISEIIHPYGFGKDYLKATNTISEKHPLRTWFIDHKQDGIVHHISRSHLTQDLKRYLFAALFTKKNKKFPKLKDYKDFDAELLPDHDNADSGKFVDRFRVQLPGDPANTVTCHISKDGHSFIHYDIKQCRSLTVREAARIQTFPDNYYFCGPRTQQFHQVGNAVPPLLAYKIAIIISKFFN